jgi:hypothetical protein
MKYTFQMGSGAMTYISNFIKIGSGIQKLMWGIHRHTERKEIAKQSKKRNKRRYRRGQRRRIEEK